MLRGALISLLLSVAAFASSAAESSRYDLLSVTDGAASLSMPLEIVQQPDSTASSANAAVADSAAIAALDAKLVEYLRALEYETVETKCTEVDFIISTSTDSAVRAHVANAVYDHYFSSLLMGDEAVAIHIFDNWFADKQLGMDSEEEYYDAEFFAKSNRASLIGNRAPQLSLYTPENYPFDLFTDGSVGPQSDSGAAGNAKNYSILLFYDADCVKCLLETELLHYVLENCDYTLNLYAIYVGTETQKWEEFRKARLDIKSDNLNVIHLWDPDMSSDFIMKYGVTSTPKIFLVSPQKIIVGRGLDAKSLEQLLDQVFAPQDLEYGSDESMDLYEKLFEYTAATDCGAVTDIAQQIENTVLPRGDTLLYKQMTGDLLYFLTGKREAKFKCGTEAFIDRYILEREDIWNDPDDSLKVLSLARFLKELMNLCPIGEGLPGLNVPAEVLTRSGKNVKSKATDLRLSDLKNCVIIFHTPGCKICEAELAGANSLLATKSAVPNTDFVPSKIVLIDMDEIWNMAGNLPDELMQYFDLSTLPFSIVLDGNGLVSHKYVTLQ